MVVQRSRSNQITRSIRGRIVFGPSCVRSAQTPSIPTAVWPLETGRADHEKCLPAEMVDVVADQQARRFRIGFNLGKPR